MINNFMSSPSSTPNTVKKYVIVLEKQSLHVSTTILLDGGVFCFTPYVISQAASTAVTEYVLQIVFNWRILQKIWDENILQCMKWNI